ncbi:MAG: transcriptional coactivator p15/PC4 family protein [Candidatus Gastranaerophilales bacterium]|nr:transcriptional coactivator p15/PC4 family protein [Candidatus Gastranaerophilales bacterium]
MTQKDEPKILATIPRSATEQLQIAINSYKGKSYLDLRIYYTTDDGLNWNPTKKGVTVSPENIELLKDAIDEAMQELLTPAEDE